MVGATHGPVDVDDDSGPWSHAGGKASPVVEDEDEDPGPPAILLIDPRAIGS